MGSTVRLYQDIDCCLNASHNARAWRREGDDVNAGYCRGFASPRHDDNGTYVSDEDGYRKRPSFRMEWNERLIEALNELPVELVWTTTWREDARQVGTLMGVTLEPQRVLHPISGITEFPSIDWKWAAIIQEQELDPSPFIAVDDEWDGVTRHKRDAIKALGGLLISPDPNLGMSPADIEKMKAYIAEHG